VQAARADPVSLGHARPLASNPSHAIERTSAARCQLSGRRSSADLDRPREAPQRTATRKVSLAGNSSCLIGNQSSSECEAMLARSDLRSFAYPPEELVYCGPDADRSCWSGSGQELMGGSCEPWLGTSTESIEGR
jgi:hypothetical protein